MITAILTDRKRFTRELRLESPKMEIHIPYVTQPGASCKNPKPQIINELISKFVLTKKVGPETFLYKEVDTNRLLQNKNMNIDYYVYAIIVVLIGNIVGLLSGLTPHKWEWWLIFIPSGFIFWTIFSKYNFNLTVNNKKYANKNHPRQW
jgi:hypothetical protein